MNESPTDLKSLFRSKLNLMLSVIALSVGVGSFAGGLFIDLARVGAVGALLCQIIVELQGRQKRFLTSPLFLLSVIGVFFFSVFQVIWVPEGPWPSIERNFTLFVGSEAEAVIIAFCMVCLVIYLNIYRNSNLEKTLNKANMPPVFNNLTIYLFVFTLCLSLFDIAIYSLSVFQIPLPFFIDKTHFMFPPLLTFSLCLLVRRAIVFGWVYKISLFLLSIFVIGGLFYVGESKVVIFMLVSLLLFALRLADFSLSHLILSSLAAALIFLVFIQVVQHVHWKVGAHGVNLASTSFYRIFKGKGIWRQTETGYCLRNVLKVHSNDPFLISKQIFWIKALVPSVLWKNKPSISLGSEYAKNYCSKRVIGHHSASITLLGQPIIQGGIIGLVLHVGVLLLALAIVETRNENQYALSTSLVVSLLPWLIDFDQDFAMYVANLAKFFLVMLLLFIPINMIERRAGNVSV